jgi:hypothetical protein
MLEHQNTEQMQRVEISRRRPQNVAVEPLGFLWPALLMTLDGLLDGLRQALAPSVAVVPGARILSLK